MPIGPEILVIQMSSLPSAHAVQPPAGIAPGSLAAWVMALRLRSMLIAISPVLVAVALVWQRTGALDFKLALLVLGTSVLLQIVTNLQNDVGYTLRGGEHSGTRIGLPRATSLGLLTTTQVRTAIAIAIVATILIGLPVVLARGWLVLAMGIASIIGALAYMGGPRPIAYMPLGELVVFVFFGLFAVAGSDYALAGVTVPPSTWLAAVAMGTLAAAALVVNNHRDINHDRYVGRRTFPVVFGAAASRRLYAACLTVPFALLPMLAWLQSSPWFLLPLALAPAAWRLDRDFVSCPPGLPFNAILYRTFRMELAYAALLAAGAMVTRLFSA